MASKLSSEAQGWMAGCLTDREALAERLIEWVAGRLHHGNGRVEGSSSSLVLGDEVCDGWRQGCGEDEGEWDGSGASLSCGDFSPNGLMLLLLLLLLP